jgi:hypothetical protein
LMPIFAAFGAAHLPSARPKRFRLDLEICGASWASDDHRIAR